MKRIQNKKEEIYSFLFTKLKIDSKKRLIGMSIEQLMFYIPIFIQNQVVFHFFFFDSIGLSIWFMLLLLLLLLSGAIAVSEFVVAIATSTTIFIRYVVLISNVQHFAPKFASWIRYSVFFRSFFVFNSCHFVWTLLESVLFFFCGSSFDKCLKFSMRMKRHYVAR